MFGICCMNNIRIMFMRSKSCRIPTRSGFDSICFFFVGLQPYFLSSADFIGRCLFEDSTSDVFDICVEVNVCPYLNRTPSCIFSWVGRNIVFDLFCSAYQRKIVFLLLSIWCYDFVMLFFFYGTPNITLKKQHYHRKYKKNCANNASV